MARTPESTVLQIFIFQEGRFWGTECFAQHQVIMGRNPDVDLQLDDDITSRTHAAVTVSSEGLILEDLGSSNGTFVNGEPIERCYIDSRDEVAIGSFSLKFKLLGRKRPRAESFQDSTRIMQAPEEPDDRTEVVYAPSSDAQRASEIDTGPDESGSDYDHTVQVRPSQAFQPERPAFQPERPAFQPERPAFQPERPAFQPERPAFQPERQPPQNRREQIAAALREELGFEGSTERMPDLSSRFERDLQPEPDDAAETHVKVRPSPPDEPVSDFAAIDGLDSRPLAEQLEPEPPSVLYEPIEPAVEEVPTGPGLSPISAPIGRMTPSVEARMDELEPPIPQGPPPDHDFADEDELEDVEVRDFVEPFSLLNNLIRENFAEPAVPTGPVPIVEIIGYSSEKQVLRYDQIQPGKKYRLGANRFVLVQFNEKSACRVLFTDEFSGGVIVGGQTLALDGLKSEANRAGRHKGRPVYGYKLMKGDYANLIHEGGGSFIRFVHPPKLPKASRDWKFDPLHMKIFGSTFAGHFILLCIMGLLASDKQAAADVDLDRFAKVDIKDINMDKPEEEVEVPLDELPEPDKKEEEKKEEVKEEEPKEEPKEKPKKTKQRRNKRQKKGSGGGGDGGSGGVGMMAALGNLSQKKSQHNIVAAVTNLDAVRVPGGRSRYKVSGLVAKLPSSSVVLSRGRGVGVRGGVELLRGGKGRGGVAGIGPGGLAGGTTGRRKVGGVVFKTRKIVRKGAGTLSREAIAAVVRKHLKEVQACYEKNLLLNPKLAGKLNMEWVISLSGSVSIVKTQTNTMQSPAVAICVSARIKQWKFPKPKGGTVVVTYPFIFNAVGF
ncbi:MAG: AgmX/PglI C-terminal domain-containing protein [Deltaproteobacteria bacterium]|nr:AgmX/PglI C-terminal domain-containing protein [Deltaproteobacteria bacterium]